jgi:hypothetical protein
MPRVITHFNPTTLLFAEMLAIPRFGDSAEKFVVLDSSLAAGIMEEKVSMPDRSNEVHRTRSEPFIVLVSPSFLLIISSK